MTDLQHTDIFVGTCFFSSMYSIGLHNAAYVRPEKYWLMCAGLLANHLFNLNFNFLSDGVPAVVE